MLPKRKIIKKRHRRPQEENENQIIQPTSLMEKLRSADTTLVEQALAFVASMCALPQSPEDIVLIAELISILHKGSNSSVYACLYGLANLVEIEPKIVPKLFELGLDKALIQLNSNDKDLLRPIIELMTVLHSYMPEQFKYLQKGVQQSLNNDHLLSNNKEQVLQFLMRVESGCLREQIYEKIYQLFKNQEKLHIRALCGSILLQNALVRQKIGKQLLQFCDELIGDIDLQKEYKTNIAAPKVLQKAKQNETDMMQQEQEIQMMPVQDTNYHTFTDAVAAVETYLEAILILFQENAQEDIQEEEIQNEDQVIQNGGNENAVSQALAIAFVDYFTSKPNTISKNTVLTFMEGQNIVHLSLRVLAYCHSIPRQHFSIVVLKCLQNSIMVRPPEEVFQQTLLVGLHLLINCQLLSQAKHFILTIGESVLKVKQAYKDAWICLLQIISKNFNPEKCPVSAEENQKAGSILKNLLINIPHLTLQEWRAQTIDTIFDVFSNEQFDTYLVHLGILPLLKEVLVRASNQKKKRFIKEVLADIKRFLEYKSKRIHF